VAGDYHATTATFGDYDNDGRVDLYVASYLANVMHVRDYLYHNDGASFSDRTPAYILKHDATHGVQWVDFNQDGALDLSLADNGSKGVHLLFKNRLSPTPSRRSLQVMVLDAQGHATRAGSEVRVYAAGTRRLLGTRLVDSGSGYCSQSVIPLHFGLGDNAKVDVEATLVGRGREVTRVEGVDAAALGGRPLAIKTPPLAAR
jgi:hypothetical protein